MFPRAIVRRYVGLWIAVALLCAELLGFVEYRAHRPTSLAVDCCWACHCHVPDILWNFQAATHQPWMDVFLGHIIAPFIRGHNWTWYAIFVVSSAFYLYQRTAKEAIAAEAVQRLHSHWRRP